MTREEFVSSKARITREVVAQLPLDTDEGMKAAELVLASCRKSACENEEEIKIFDSIVLEGK